MSLHKFFRPIAPAAREATNLLCMDINRIYEALTSPTPPHRLKRAGAPFASACALALLIQIERVPLIALSYSATELDARFPHDLVPPCARRVFKEELSRYRAWRRTLFDLFLLERGSLADQDPIAGLMRIARLEYGGRCPERLRVLRHAVPTGMTLTMLTRSAALQIDKRLCSDVRPQFRAALSVLDRLQVAPLASASGHLLPSAKIGRLPKPSEHLYHAPLPQQLEAVYAVGPPRLKRALPFVYRLCLTTGILSGSQDVTLGDLAQKCMSLWEVNPADHGFHKPTPTTLKSYIWFIGQHAGTDFPPLKRSQPAVCEAWTDLRSLMRQHGTTALI